MLKFFIHRFRDTIKSVIWIAYLYIILNYYFLIYK